jgi:ketosteroid isomerase-like protein
MRTSPHQSSTEMQTAACAEIQEMERLRFEAMEAADVEQLTAMFHDQLVYSHSNGSRDSRDLYIAKIKEGRLKYRGISHPVEKIVLVGNTALVAGRMTATAWVNGKAKWLDNNSLAVWVREDGGWKFLAYQPTPLPRSVN